MPHHAAMIEKAKREERERCAKIADQLAATLRTMNMAQDGANAAAVIADKIRERILNE